MDIFSKEYLGLGSLILSLLLMIGKKYLISLRRFLFKSYKATINANKIADEYIDKELNTIDKEFVSMLRHHSLCSNIVKLSREDIPYSYVNSIRGKAQSIFALCSIILIETYGEQLEAQFKKLIPNLTVSKQIAELEIVGQLRLTNTLAYEKMRYRNIPIEVIIIFFTFYNKTSDVLFNTLYDNLQMSFTLKDVLKCTLHTCNYYTYSFSNMVKENINSFNGDIITHLPDVVYDSVDFKELEVLKINH